MPIALWLVVLRAAEPSAMFDLGHCADSPRRQNALSLVLWGPTLPWVHGRPVQAHPAAHLKP